MNRSFPLSPPPNHTPLYLLPLAHGPTTSCIGWVQAGGAWALRVLPFQFCPRVCLLLMFLPQPGDSPSAFPGLSCGLSFGLSLQSGAGSSMIMGFTFLWPTFGFSLLPATLICYSCRNDLILLDPFLGQPFIPFLSGLSQALFCFYSWAPMSLWVSLWASTARLLILWASSACLLIPHSHGLCY